MVRSIGFLCHLEFAIKVCGLSLHGLTLAVCAFMGFALSYAPSLFIIPISIPGFSLALVYLFLSSKRDRDTTIYKYFKELGGTTLGNMVICLGACTLLINTVRVQSGGARFFNNDVLMNLFVCGLFLYFAYQMKDRQGSEMGRNGLLAIYDAGRRRIRSNGLTP